LNKARPLKKMLALLRLSSVALIREARSERAPRLKEKGTAMVNIGDIALASRLSLDAIMDEYYYVGSVNTGDGSRGIPAQWDRQVDARVAPVY
jgi:hypothetical protein